MNDPAAPSPSFAFEQGEDRLLLRALHRPQYGPISADWQSPDVRRRVQGGKRQLLARAVGLNKRAALHVVDATAGLGRDAYVLAALGATLTLIERSRPVSALLADALARAQAAQDPAAARMRHVEADAIDWLQAHPRSADVVLLDPMYPHSGKSALAKKEMQLLRELNGGDADADALLPVAMAAATRRVVVKRPLKAPPLAGHEPSLSLAGSQARFDLYLITP